MNADDILRIMDKAKEVGIHSVHVKDSGKTLLKFSFHPSKLAPVKGVDEVASTSWVPDVKAEQLVKPISTLDEMTPEEVLFYATPYYDEIQAQKEEHKKKLEEESK